MRSIARLRVIRCAQRLGRALLLAAHADQPPQGLLELEQVQAAATRLEVTADLNDVLVGELSVEVWIERLAQSRQLITALPPRARATTPLDSAACSPPLPFGVWTLLPDVKPAACAWSHSARCSRRRPRNRRLITVPLATPGGFGDFGVTQAFDVGELHGGPKLRRELVDRALDGVGARGGRGRCLRRR